MKSIKKLLNTLFISSEDIYLSLDGENVVINQDKTKIKQYPLHIFERIIMFSYAGASPALMGKCADMEIDLVFCTPRGRFLARTAGITHGNVLLRREQYRIADSPERAVTFARHMIFGKLYNGRWSLERTLRDHKLRVGEDAFRSSIDTLKSLLPQVLETESLDTLRGLEGAGAKAYFDVFNDMILRDKEHFFFHGRNRRPPLDNVNAMLSFAYSLLASECASALESAGLDAYVGFLHQDRPGRTSLALDLMEELRPCVADRFVLTLINNRQLTAADFVQEESGAVRMTDNGRSTFLKAWKEKKEESITHPYLQEKMPWGQIPYAQALLLNRCIRGDMDAYPPFLWK